MIIKKLKNVSALSLFFCCLIALPTSGFKLPPNDQNKLVVGFVQQAIPISDVTSIGGFAGERIRKNRENYLKTFPIDEYLDFIIQRTHKDWTWVKAEQHGKWIESSILSSAQSKDDTLRKKVTEIFTRLIASQEAEGYLGATSPEVRKPEKPLRGMDAYELYFVQHALLTAYEQWNDPRGLAAAQKLGDYFLKYIGPGKAEFWPGDFRYPENQNKKLTGHSAIAGHSVHYSWEGTLLIDPMLRLYQLSGDQRYLDWSKWVISNIDKWSGWDAFSKLSLVADGKMGINEVQPYVHSHTFQMNFLGFLRMYQITGDTTYLYKVKGVWDDVAKRQMYITGGVSVGEHYERGYVKPLIGNVVETCATMSWMQLTQYLLELTSDTKYADAMEKLLWNHVFAAQSFDGDGNRYHTAPNGNKPEGYYRNPDCCTASGHRIISLLPTYIYSTGKNSVYINQFVQSSADFTKSLGKAVSMKQNTQYPEKEAVQIVVNTQKNENFTINLRIPAWCKSPTVKVNGQIIANVKPGSYAQLTRSWRNKDKIDIILPMKVAWVKLDHFTKPVVTRLAGGEEMYGEVEDPKAPYALMRGPVVYVLDNIWWNRSDSDFPGNVMTDIKYIIKDNPQYKEVNLHHPNILGPVFEVPVKLLDNKVKTVIMLPFSNIGIWYLDANNKPEKNSKTNSYAIFCQGIKE